MVNGNYVNGDVEIFYAKSTQPNHKVCMHITSKHIELLNNSIRNLVNLKMEYWIGSTMDMDAFLCCAEKNLSELEGIVFVDDPAMEERETSKLGMFFEVDHNNISHYNKRWGINITSEGKYIALSPNEINNFYDTNKMSFKPYRGTLNIISELVFLHEVGHLATSVTDNIYRQHRTECESQANWFASLNLDFTKKYLLGEKTKFQPPEYQDYFTNPRLMPGQVFVNPCNGTIIDVKLYDKKVYDMIQKLRR